MSLRRKLMLAGVLLVLVVLAAAGGLQYAVERRELEAAAETAQETVLRALARSCEEALIDESDLAMLNHFRGFLNTEGLLYTMITDLNGVVVMHSRLLEGERSWFGRKLNDAFTRQTLGMRAASMYRVEEQDRTLLVWLAPLSPKGRPRAVLRMAYDEAAIRRRIDEALVRSARRFAIVAALCLLLAMAGASLLSRSLDRRLRLLDEAARRFAAGDFGHVVGMKGSDELARLGGGLDAMARRIHELDQLKAQFFRDITHDLKAPLGAVQTYVELILSGRAGPVAPAQREHLGAVRQAAGTLRQFVDNILELARLESTGAALQRRTVDPRELALAAVRLASDHARALAVGLQCSAPQGLPPVSADERLLLRVLSNLLANSLNFTPKGGRIILAVARPQRADAAGGVIFSVTDTGCGIPSDRLPRLFTRFYKVPENQARARFSPGSGLGLAICKALVEAHGGRIWAESKPGSGARFSFMLPLARSAAAAGAGSV